MCKPYMILSHTQSPFKDCTEREECRDNIILEEHTYKWNNIPEMLLKINLRSNRLLLTHVMHLKYI